MKQICFQQSLYSLESLFLFPPSKFALFAETTKAFILMYVDLL
jgi:hypothetical protein